MDSLDITTYLNTQMQKEKYSFPLIYSVRIGDEKKVQELLDAGEHPDKRGDDFRNPLALAFATGNLKIARILLEKGANPNLLCGRDAIGFLAPLMPKHEITQENAWLHTKQAYDLLKEFNADFTIKNSLSQESLEDYFARLMPSAKLRNTFK